MPAFKDLFKVVEDQPTQQPALSEEVMTTIQEQISQNLVMVYMKGDRQQPQCGFSAAVVEMLNEIGVPYTTRNVLEDPAIRQGIKTFSSWPTIPQVYVAGEFVGGCDIITDMHHKDTLRPLLESAAGK